MFVALLMAGMVSCKDSNREDNENTNNYSGDGYERGEMENANGGNPTTGGERLDSTGVQIDSDVETGTPTGRGTPDSGKPQ